MNAGIFVVFAGRAFGGPQTYEVRIAEAVARLDPESHYQVFALEPDAPRAYAGLPANASCHVLKPRQRWLSTALSLPYQIRRRKLDLLHATVVPPLWCPAPLVFTMHDVTPFAYPDFYPKAITLRLRAMITRGLKAARMVICVSRNAMETTRELFRMPEERFAVVHHGVDPKFRPVPGDEARRIVAANLGLNFPYFLHVGHLEKRKNTARLIDAFAAFRSETGLDIKLVFAGARNFDTSLIDEAIARNGVREHVVEAGEVRDEDMCALYSAAEALAFPTLWEGFGLPVLEAMACGTPVLTSRVSSLPEVAGDAAELVDPLRVDEIAAALCRIATDSELRASMRARGLEQARRFTWENAGRGTLEAYRRALG